MKLDIQENHNGVPCIFFTGMDAKEQCDGFTLGEMNKVVSAINSAIKELQSVSDDKDQMEFDFIKDYEC